MVNIQEMESGLGWVSRKRIYHHTKFMCLTTARREQIYVDL